METPPDSSFEAQSEFALQLSCFVKDIQQKNVTFPDYFQNTVADAVDWMRVFGVRCVPVLTGGSDQRTITSLQAIEAETLLQRLPDRLEDKTAALEDFFAMPLSEFPCRRLPIVFPQMDLAALIRRMYREQKDLLLVFEGIRFVGLVTVGDIFDAMIGTAVLDDALFNTDSPNTGSVVENARMCCLKQPISGVLDPSPVHQLSMENTILTAVRILLNQSSRHVLLSDHLQNRHQPVTAENVLLALLRRFEQSASSDTLRGELMRPLASAFDIKPLALSTDSSVFEAVQAVHFNSLTCAAVLSDQQQLNGLITTDSLLRAFLDSIDRAFMMLQDGPRDPL